MNKRNNNYLFRYEYGGYNKSEITITDVDGLDEALVKLSRHLTANDFVVEDFAKALERKNTAREKIALCSQCFCIEIREVHKIDDVTKIA